MPDQGNNLYESEATEVSPQITPDSEAMCIYQCLKCRSVLGDSFSLLDYNETLNLISLRAVTEDVEICDELATSSESADLGSTYSPMVCALCRDTIGLVYRTTPRHIDSLRDNYSLLESKTRRYVLGSTHRHKDEDIYFNDGGMRMEELFYKSIRVVKTLNERLSTVESHVFGEDYAFVPSQSGT